MEAYSQFKSNNELLFFELINEEENIKIFIF